MSDELTSRIAELTARYLDKTILPDDALELQEICKTNPKIRRFMATSLLSHLLLESLAKEAKEKNKAMESGAKDDLFKREEIRQISTETIVVAPEDQIRERMLRPRQQEQSSSGSNSKMAPSPTKTRSIPWFPAILLIFLSFICWLSWEHHCETVELGQKTIPDDPAPMVRIEETLNVVSEPGAPAPRRGETLCAGKLFLKKGFVKLRFARGAELILKGPSDLTINSDMSLFCQTGLISAFIPPASVGFEILTPFGRVQDQGTAFVLEVNDEENRIDVVRGKVDFIQHNGTLHHLFEAEAGLLTIAQKYSTLKFERERFIDEGSFNERLREQTTRIEQKRQQNNLALDTRKDLLVRLELNGKRSGQLENLSSQGRSILSRVSFSNLTPTGGVSFGKKASHFQSRRSTLSIDLPGSFPAMTFVVQLRVDRLYLPSHYLMISQSFHKKTGTICWLLNEKGESRFFIDGQDPSRSNDTATFSTREILSKKEHQIWHTLAVVCDPVGQIVTHYFDGEQVSQEKWNKPLPLTPGKLFFGNMEYNSKNRKGALDGAFQEIRLFNRALSGKEIKDLTF